MPLASPARPLRGEIWWVNFNSPVTTPTPPAVYPQLPTTGSEIYKTRPAVVMSMPGLGYLDLAIVVPITSWQPKFQTNQYFWMVKLIANSANNLDNDSAANVFQIKSVSTLRFAQKKGILTTAQMDLIATTIAVCIGYQLPAAPPPR
jgi:mRNA interferase MazF